ncbi:hypothetical protein D4764_0239310 [Takifugu flavidus]|uniref:Uncharacterized protein n=1 Tax=Takifugu flavidus TaxID=433684 RepID=A0A5C6MGI8_9TELE|nr:hypothetical protein D4764_0239310 [Takifugu flavidus]
MSTAHRGVSKLFSRALDGVRKSRGQSWKNEDRLSPMSKKEPEHWKQEREENRSNTQRTTIKIVSRREEWRGEESWQQEFRHLKERLVGKDQQICRVEPERKRLAEAHVDTLALLSSTQAGLKQEEQRCARLEEQCCKKLADQEQRHQIEIKNQEEGFQRERKLEEMLWNHEEILQEKETSNRKEIQLLTERIVQLQTSDRCQSKLFQEEKRRRVESWQQELRHLKEPLVGKDQQICRVEPERKRLAEAHVDTLALLSSTQAGLKQEEQRCARLEEQL